ncbi:hypothetical protein LTS10_009027 [Elasticomyces elasticus]|nr:hypothetical protein LTS10_009027 [Elasticomyces elasticus]
MAATEGLDSFSSLTITAPPPASNADSAAPITQSSTFLTIPAEIRNDIYERAFNKLWKTGVDRFSGKSYIRSEYVDLFKAAPPSKAPLLVCRQMNSEAKGLYGTAYRRYWKEVSFYTEIPEKSKSVAAVTLFAEHDLRHVRRLTLSITWEEMQILVWGHDRYVYQHGSSQTRHGEYLDFDRSPNGQWCLDTVDSEAIHGQRSQDYYLVMELDGDGALECHNDEKPWTRRDDFKPIE